MFSSFRKKEVKIFLLNKAILYEIPLFYNYLEFEIDFSYNLRFSILLLFLFFYFLSIFKIF